ncbi:MAG: hypothetical protein M3Y60_13025, partial [Bacteroidota bacterium]|nr:hypothetical protein [Bacteroidota bacterium]
MLRYFFILLYFFSSCLVVAQDFEIRQYSIPEGLPQSQIFAIEEDNYGYLWVGTASGGLSKFDGTKFSNYTTRDGLLSNSINDFEIDSQNNIWVAHPNGISKFNGDNFKTYPIPDTLTFLRRILSLHLEADTLHISSLPSMYGRIVNDSLQYWDGSLFPGKGVSAIVRGPEHALYFFLSSYEVFIRKGMVAKMLPLPTSAWLPRSIYRTPDGLIFQSAEQAAAISFKEGTSVLLPNKDLRRRNLLYDSVRNEFWRPAGDSIVIERPGKHSSIYVGSFVNRMLMDRAGSVWIATDDRGLLKVNRKSMRRVESTAGLRVSNMLLVNGDLWFGTYGQGLYKYRDGALTRFFFDTAVSERNSINGLESSPSGEIWVSTQRGIGIFDTTGKPLRWITKITEQLPMLESTTVAFDANGIPWSGTLNMGAIMLGADTTYLFNRSNSEFPNSAVSSLYLPFYKKLAIGHQSGYSLADSASVQTFNISPVKNSMVLAMSSYQDSLVVLATSGAGIVIHSPKSGRW